MGAYNAAMQKPDQATDDCTQAVRWALRYCLQYDIVNTADIDDATSIAAMAVIECRPQHNANLSDFHNFARRRVWWRLTDHFRKQHKVHQRERPLEMSGMV